MKIRLLSGLAVAGLLAGTAALAQAQPPAPPPPHGGQGFFEKMDTNKDGVVTRAEVTASLNQRFAALDTDKNGVISAAERKADRDRKVGERLDARFAAADTDKNGQLSRAEFGAAHDRRRGPGDDGAAADRPGGKPGFDRGRGGFGHGFGKGGWGKGGFGKDDQADMTKEQFMARPLRMFDVLDSNDDGKITAAERDAARDQMGRRGPARPDMKPRS